MDNTTKKPTGGQTRCGDCNEPCAHMLCLGCVARIYATPVQGEHLPWDRERLVAELCNEALESSNEQLALIALFVAQDRGENLEHTLLCDVGAIRQIAKGIRCELRALLDEKGTHPTHIAVTARFVGQMARIVVELARDLERAAQTAKSVGNL